MSGNVKVNSTYDNDLDKLNLKAGFNYSRSQDKGESAEIKPKGDLQLRYDRDLQQGLGLYALSDYKYNKLTMLASTSLIPLWVSPYPLWRARPRH